MKWGLILADALTSDLETLRNGVVLLLDMKDLSSKNFSFELEKVFVTAFQEAYPLRIKQFIIVNAPLLIRGVINCAKPFMKSKMRERIESVKTGSGLWKWVDKDQVPSCVGGTFDEKKDGSYPTTAWQFVVSKVSGDLPDLTVKSNRKKGKEARIADEMLLIDPDVKPTLIGSSSKKEENFNADDQKADLLSALSSDDTLPPVLQDPLTAADEQLQETIISSLDAALEAKSSKKLQKKNEKTEPVIETEADI